MQQNNLRFLHGTATHILCESMVDEQYFFSLPALNLPGVRILPVVLVPTVLVVTILVLLCGVICVVYQLKKEVKYVTVRIAINPKFHSKLCYHMLILNYILV